MREFFKGWRRKVGCGLLVIAVALLGAWGRSLWIVDDVSVFLHYVQSANGHLVWFRDDKNLSDEPAVYWLTDSYDPGRHVRLGSPIVDWQFQFAGFGAGSVTTVDDVSQLWIVSYWYFICPLTLLSAWLLLWKPRKKPQDDSSSSAPFPNP